MRKNGAAIRASPCRRSGKAAARHKERYFNMKRQLTAAALALAAALAASAPAGAAVFSAPKHYSIIIADGEKVSGIFTEKREIELGEGRHQVVVQFKGSFKKGGDRLIAYGVNPVVVNIPAAGESDVYSFTYPRILSYDEANDFADRQDITLTVNGRPAAENEASYLILKSDRGFQLDRDYIAELKSLDLLYVSEENLEKQDQKAKDLFLCRDSPTDCPKVVVTDPALAARIAEESRKKGPTPIVRVPEPGTEAPAAAPAPAPAPAADAAPAAAAPAPAAAGPANAQMLEGFKSIYQSADPATRAAFKEWLEKQK